MELVHFTGEETEKEFLEKCLQQWELTVDDNTPSSGKMMQLGALFYEIRHRINELD